MLSKFDEMKLIARCALGDDRRAFGTLVEAYQTEIRRFFLNITFGDAALSDDLAQETFIKAYTSIRSFKGLSKFSTWLYRIATNETITFLNRNNAVVMEEPETCAAQLEADTYFDGDSLQTRLQEAIQTLPPKQRMVFNMKYYDDMKYEEISSILGTSIGALKASYHLAVKKISSFFDDDI